jgi:signal transduction histidine kinase
VRRAPILVAAAGIAFGLVAEWSALDDAASHALAAADLVVGCVLLVCGAIAWTRRPASRVGALMSVAGLTWFLGTLVPAALYVHRGPLVHLHLSYPSGRVPGRLALAVVAAAYVDAVVRPLAGDDVLTLVLSGAVALTAVQVFAGTSGPARRAGGPALGAALAYAGVLALGALDRLAGGDDAEAVLWAYDVVIAVVAVVLVTDLLRGRWTDAVVARLVVDLGASRDAATVRAKLAEALGDRSLAVGYRLADTDVYVDDAGDPVEPPTAVSGRVMTPVGTQDEPLAILVHDESVLADPGLLESVAAAARVAVANARLQAEAKAHASELDASRRRIVEAGDAQRRRLAEQLRLGAELRLATVAALLAETRESDGAATTEIAALEAELGEARRELGEFAQGVHPTVLAEQGLLPALQTLAARSAIPVELAGDAPGLAPPAEAAIFFVCSEALANATKHAQATSVRVALRQGDGQVVLEVEDDGVGGADPARGSGLRGLADRVLALGGRLSVESPPGGGTRLEAAVPSERDGTAR